MYRRWNNRTNDVLKIRFNIRNTQSFIYSFPNWNPQPPPPSFLALLTKVRKVQIKWINRVKFRDTSFQAEYLLWMESRTSIINLQLMTPRHAAPWTVPTSIKVILCHYCKLKDESPRFPGWGSMLRMYQDLYTPQVRKCL